jgi:hypothetical protein
MAIDLIKLQANIGAYSSIVQIALATGKLLAPHIRDFVGWLAHKRGEVLSNEELDAITQGVLEQDTIRHMIAAAEAAPEA